jgi:hypothetical protein
VVLEDPQDVHVGHAHTELHETACAGTAESRDDVVQAVDDSLGSERRRRGSLAIDSSHEMNNL